jgi:hypothetical protein
MFVDLQGETQVNFVFPSSPNIHTPSTSPSKQSIGSKTHSYQSLQHKESTPLLVRSSSIGSGLEETRGKVKIPLFVPSQVIKPDSGKLSIPERKSSRLSPDRALTVGDATQDEQSKGQENHSKEALSEASDWSTTVQFDAPKQEVFEAKSEASIAPDRSAAAKPVSRLEDRKRWGEGGHFQGRLTPSAIERVESVEGGSTVLHEYQQGMRVLQNCSAYFHRIRRHLRRDSNANGNNMWLDVVDYVGILDALLGRETNKMEAD